ncbi:MAG: glycosyltransferase family 1 protein [Bacteroidetes bacterium]|nr:MAG: glycosyltransferase family 1 protein [Bacteroidota bacterium]
MKIALIHYRLILRGGLERRLVNYAEYLQAQGHEVHVIVAKRSPEAQLHPGVHIHTLSPGLVPKVFRQRYFDYLLGRFMQKNSFDLSLSLMRTSHQDMVLCPANHLGFLQAEGRGPRSLSDREQIRSDRMAFEHSQLILAASQMMKTELTELFHISEEKIRVLPPPVNTSVFRPELKVRKAEFRKKYGISPDKRVYVFVSSSHKRKGLPLLLDLFAQLQDQPVELVIAGMPAVETSLPNVKDLQFSTQMEELYAAADFTIHPSYYEPFGQIVSESLCCGTPVLISDRVGARECITPQEGLVLPYQDVSRWKEAILHQKPEDFAPDPHYAARNHLSVSDHVEQILAFARHLKGAKSF